MMRLFAACG